MFVIAATGRPQGGSRGPAGARGRAIPDPGSGVRRNGVLDHGLPPSGMTVLLKADS